MKRTFHLTKPAPKQGPTSGNALLWGCLAATAIMVVCAIAVAASIFFGGRHLLNKFTDDEPMELPVVEMEQEAYDALAERVKAFAEALDAGESIEPLQLNEIDINALIQNHPNWTDASGHLYISIEDDIVRGKISIPFGDRYLNADGTFELRFERDQLFVYIKDASVKGESVPEFFLSGMRDQNMAEDMMSNPDTQAFFENIDTLEVTDGKIVVTPK